MILFNRVVVVGVGLIGGSIALDIKQKHLANEIIGIARHKKSLNLAKKIGAIDRGALGLDIVKDADLLIFCAPVNSIIDLAPKIFKLIKKDCIVTDVGSTKREIVSSLERFFPNYLGSHPLAGSQKRGIKNAHAGIFKNSLCVLTPTKNTSRKAFRNLKLFWKKLGCNVVLLTPDIHDEILSFVSHLPHILAFSLISSIPDKYYKFASSGLKDTTRIAASDSELWQDVFLSNRKNILQAIKILEENLSFLKSAILKKDKKKLALLLKRAKIKREKLG